VGQNDGDLEFTVQLDLEGNCQVIGKRIKNNLENGQEFIRLTKTPYQNLTLDK